MFFIMCNRHTNSVAHNCYGNTKFKTTKPNYLLQKPNNHGINKTNHDNLKVTTAMANRSRQKQIHHGKNKFITAKSNSPRQNQIHHGIIKFITANSNSSRQNQIHHGKNQMTGRRIWVSGAFSRHKRDNLHFLFDVDFLWSIFSHFLLKPRKSFKGGRKILLQLWKR